MTTKRIVRRNRKPAERAIIFAAIVGDLPLDKTRELLQEAGYGDRELPDRSWELLRNVYRPKILQSPELLGEFIYKPKAMGDLD